MQNNYKQLFEKLKRYSVHGIFLPCMLLAAVFTVQAQQQITVTGQVTSSDDGSSLPGVSVLIKGTSLGTSTDADGKYTINVSDGNAVLVFSYISYVTQEITVASQTMINVTLITDDQLLNEVVIVGYGTQQKVTLTGAVSSIKGDEMLQTRNENPQNMLTGRIAGVRVWQRSAEPGTFTNNFDIRGMGEPLVVIDGIPRTVADFQRLNPNDIDDISVLKDASAAIYGVRAANGVVLVTTKKGTIGKATVSYTGSYTVQQPSNLPELADPFQTMTLYNERSMNSIDNPTIIYGPEKFEQYRSGELRSADWNSLIIANTAPQTQHNISMSGGTEKTQYFIGGGFMYQEGFFKSGDLNYNKVNLRSNITTELAEGLKFNINLAGMSDQRNTPYSSAVDIIRNYWRQGVLFPAYADPENTLLSYEGLDLEQNTVAMMSSDISGFRKYNQKTFQSSAALDFDLGTLSGALKGLTARAMVSFDYRNDNNTSYRREYNQYMYDADTDTYISKLYNLSQDNQIRREMFTRQQVLGQFLLNYDRTIGTNHHITGLLGWESQTRQQDNFFAQNNLAFDMEYLLAGPVSEAMIAGMLSDPSNLYKVANSAALGRINYTYAGRYIADIQFRYDGSSKFVEDNQWGFFPSALVAWRVSEEPFFQSISALSFVDQLKIRASYGVTANDDALNYEWYAGYIYPETNSNSGSGYYNQFAPGYVFDGNFVNGASLIVPNEKITWWTAHSFNIGADFQGWNGLFGFSVDYFDRKREGLYARRNGEVPTVVGTGAPLENANSDRQYGIDLELSHRNRVGGLAYRVKAIGTITRREHLFAVQNGPYGNSYDRWRNDNLNNRYQGVQFGYVGDGRYTSWEDIWSFPIYKDRDILPGDYKYEDWNGDGQINGLDERPFAYDQTPWVNFSLSFDANYKNFDLSFLFQGTALGSMQYREPLYNIWGSNGGGTLTQYLDRWHPEDPTADPYDPETQWNSGYYGFTGNYPFENSTFNRVSTAYLRLKSIELGYNLPKRNPSSSLNVRVFANAYNLFTITGVRFVDPEHPDDELGRMYPLNKTYTVGLTVGF